MDWKVTRSQAMGNLDLRQRWAIEKARAQQLLAKFNPHHKPSGPGGGEFTSGSGAEEGSPPGKGKHPGEGYSKHAYVDEDGVIHTTKVADAQRALFEDRKVDLDQLKKVSTLIDKLGKVAKQAIEDSKAGKAPPRLNMCNVSVAGENLFCQNHKDIPRVKMPQLDTDQTKALLDHLKDQGYTISKEREYAHHLRATQNEISGVKVAIQAMKAAKKPERLLKRLVVSKDDYILDGHHHYAAKLGLDAADNNLTNDTMMKVYRVNIGIMDLLKEAKKFSGPPKPATELGYEPECQDCGDRDAELEYWLDHFRQLAHGKEHGGGNPYHKPSGPGGGQFTTGPSSGGGSTPKPPATPEKPGAQGELYPGQPGASGPITGPKKKHKLEDFKKDRIELERAIEDNAIYQEGFLEGWDKHIGMDPAEFKQKLLGGIKGTMKISMPSSTGDKFIMDGTLLGEKGESLGSYTRSIDFRDMTAENEYLNIYRQRHDLGKQMLKGNIDTYKELGIKKVHVHANIDVGGYAWAKYGYVPSKSSWRSLSDDLHDKIGGAGGGGPVSSWDDMTSDQQEEVETAWRRETESEFYDSEVENWRDNGGDLSMAKEQMARKWPEDVAWLDDALATSKDWEKVDRKKLIDATTVEYDDRRGDGEGDPKVTVEATSALKGDEQYEDYEKFVIDAFNKAADYHRGYIDPPDYLYESVSDLQNDVWSSMRDRDKYKWADEYGHLPEYGESEGDLGDIDESERGALKHLVDSDDPKAIWAIADSEHGKQLLLGTDWHGDLKFDDEQSMARFNAYIAKAKAKQQGSKGNDVPRELAA